MKKSFCALLCAGLLAACQSDKPSVSGTLSGVDSDTLLVMSFPYDDYEARRVDTVALQNGTFSIELGDSVLKQVYIQAMPSHKPNADGSIPAASMKNVSILCLPGNPVTVSGSIDDYKLEGGAFYAAYNEVEESFKDLDNKMDSLASIVMALSQQGVARDSIMKIYEPMYGWDEEVKKIKEAYVRAHLDQEISVYLLSQISNEKWEEVLAQIPEQVKNGVMAPVCKAMMESIEKDRAQKQAEEAVQPGKPAPEFTLKDLEGNDFSLSSLRGKYVVLDFWGSWCGWCIKGIPEMKKSYAKYKGKMEFVGIDCNDTEDKWKAAVAEHELPWINVRYEGEPNVPAMYAITGFPTKFVIDPEGNIAHRVVGEDPAFYTYLDELMK